MSELLFESSKLFDLYGVDVLLDEVSNEQWGIINEKKITVERFTDVMTNALNILFSKEYFFIKEWKLQTVEVVDSDCEIFNLGGFASSKNLQETYLLNMMNVDSNINFCKPSISKKIIKTSSGISTFNEFCNSVNYFL